MQECEIDLFIDLNSYSSTQRLPLLLAPVAPITAAWFNLYATSGLPGIDLVIGDREVVRAEEESEYTERVACLPGSYLTFQVGHRAPPIGPPPCEANGYVTLGSLVSQYKLTDIVLDDWAAILRRADRSRLLLGNRALQSTCNREYLLEQFAQRGIDAERIGFLPPAEHYEFLSYYNQIDLALDAYPYNGGTTTMEAIWQGVPVLTFDGDRWAVRHSRRWLLSDDARDIAIAPDGTAWIATAAGISAIRTKKMTLADKADHYLKIARARHVRPPGFVQKASLQAEGDLSTACSIARPAYGSTHSTANGGRWMSCGRCMHAGKRSPSCRRNCTGARTSRCGAR